MAATAMHVAAGHESLAGLALGVATGADLPPLTMETIHEGNAQSSQANAGVSQQQVLDTLRDGGAKAATIVRGLSDEQLAGQATVIGRPMSARDVIAGILINHPVSHLRSIREAIGDDGGNGLRVAGNEKRGESKRSSRSIATGSGV